MIRIDAMWLAADPIDMRADADRLLARIVQVFGAAQAHHGYLFANARGTRVKLLVHDGFGLRVGDGVCQVFAQLVPLRDNLRSLVGLAAPGLKEQGRE